MRLVQVITPFIFVVAAVTSQAQDGPATKSNDGPQFETWWAELAQPDPEASRALLQFASHPKQAVAFLKTKLKPLKLERKRLQALLEQLGSDDQEVWMAAFEELDYFDPRITIDLESLMDMVQGDARSRVVELMSGRPPGTLDGKAITLRPVGDDGYNFFAGGVASWWAEHKVARINIGYSNRKRQWTRAVRAIVLLNHIGTDDAIKIVKRVGASGHADAQPTIVARKLVLERNKRP